MSIIKPTLPKITYPTYEIRKKNQTPKIKKPDFPQLTFLLPPEERQDKLKGKK